MVSVSHVKPTHKDARKLLAAMDGDDALDFIEHLVSTDKKMNRQLRLFLKDKRKSEADLEDVAASVQSDLELLDVEDLWDNSGESRYGYNDPSEVGCEMFDDAPGLTQTEYGKPNECQPRI